MKFSITLKSYKKHDRDAVDFGSMMTAAIDEFGAETILNIEDVTVHEFDYLKWAEEADTADFAKSVLDHLFFTSTLAETTYEDTAKAIYKFAEDECLTPDDCRADAIDKAANNKRNIA